jgi:hypothetical protein
MAQTNQDIEGFYQKYLGRGYNDPGEGQGWIDNPDAETMIKGSGEAQAFAKRPPAGAQRSPWNQNTGQPADTQWSNQTVATQPSAPGQPAAPSGTPGRITGPGGGYSEGTKTYDNRGTLQGDVGYNRAQLKQDIMNAGSGFNLEQFLATNPNAKGVSFTRNSAGQPERIVLPDGESFDVVGNIGAGGTGKGWWGSEKDWQQESAAGGAGGAGSPGGGGASGGGGSNSFGSSSSGYGTNSQRDDLYNTLMNRSNQSLNINAQTDPNIRQQADPYAAAVERERRRYMAQTAEGGGPLANIQGEARLSSEKAGQASGLFESQLIGREMSARRDEIAQALQGRMGMLSQEQQLAMQRELAQLDASIRNRQISSGNEQFMGSLGLQSENQNNYWDALRSGLING